MDNKCYEGCNYLLGYVIEMALKARICTLLNLATYPEQFKDYKTHDLGKLLILSGLSNELDEKEINEVESKYKLPWSVVIEWNEIFRYKFTVEYNKNSADEAYSNTQYICTFFILNWIKEKW